uniref:NS7 protein n=2 Tax=Bottlenose dolphin coronavirus HKU22 TaxID=1433215 RepID=V5TGF7_BWCOV|nr:NS7 protein [Bottlenose dolphin coronavirus HKU22]
MKVFIFIAILTLTSSYEVDEEFTGHYSKNGLVFNSQFDQMLTGPMICKGNAGKLTCHESSANTWVDWEESRDGCEDLSIDSPITEDGEKVNDCKAFTKNLYDLGYVKGVVSGHNKCLFRRTNFVRHFVRKNILILVSRRKEEDTIKLSCWMALTRESYDES